MTSSDARRPRRPNPTGFTLIEVLAGSALLGMLLVSILLANVRFSRQASLAERKLEAAAAADALLEAWWKDPAKFPRASGGSVANALAASAPAGTSTGGLTWRTHRLTNPDAEKLGVEAICLEIFEGRPSATPGPAPGGDTPASGAGAKPLIAVEVVLPEERHDHE